MKLLRPIFLLLNVIFALSLKGQSDIPEPNARYKNLSPKMYTDSLFSIAKKYRDNDAIRSIQLFNEVIDSSAKNGYTRLLINSYNNLGLIKGEQNFLAQAFTYHQKAFKAAAEANDSLELAATYNYIADVYKRLRLQEKGIQYMKKAIDIAKLRRDSVNLAIYTERMGHIFMDWAEETNDFNYYYLALKNYSVCLHINEARKDPKRLSVSYIDLANAYLIMNRHGGDKSFLRKSISYSLQGQEYAYRGKYTLEWAINTINLGEANYELGNYDMALAYFEQCLPVFQRLNKKLWYASTLVDIALVRKNQGRFDEAITLIHEANKIVQDYEQVEPFQNYKYLADIYEAKKDYKSAYEANRKYQKLYNHAQNLQTMQELEGKQLELDNERKDKAIELLNEENKYQSAQHKKDLVVNYSLISLTVLLLVLMALIYNRSRILKKAKEAAEQSRILQQQFLANTSHEIRTPMNGIIGMAEQLAHTSLTTDQREGIEIIKQSATGLLGIINDVLDLSKIQAGKVVFEKHTFSLYKLLEEVRAIMSNQAEMKDLAFKIKVEENVPEYISGDEVRLRQILLNLLSNAVKFTERGSVEFFVRKELTGEKMNLIFIVKDSGIGIPHKRTGEIFESFVQLEPHGARNTGGTGLGLAITKSLVQLQNGTIQVKSKVGEGSVFTVKIPFEVGNETQLQYEEKKAGENHENRYFEELTILVVEDNPINQKVISKILERWGTEFYIASVAVEAFEILSETRIDIILMDIELPGLNGWEATQYIRTKFKEPQRSVPILALTAYAYDTEKQQSFESGMNDILVKPYSEADLYKKISRLVYNDRYDMQEMETEGPVSSIEMRYTDDKRGLIELYNLFLSEMPEYLRELNAAAAVKDFKSISRIAHKIKSPVSLFGEKETIEALRILNSSIPENADELLEKVFEDCSVLLKEIQKKLNSVQ